MPELPEVEMVREVLEPQLRGRGIRAVEVRRPEVIARPDAAAFAAALPGREFEKLSRRGKFLILHLRGGGEILLHLRMTGCLLLMPEEMAEERHTHVVFHLSGGQALRFSDMRRFGRFTLLEEGETCAALAHLGLEPFDARLGPETLREALGRSRSAIKSALLRQDVVAGIGNIYSDEICFAARLHPARPAASLSAQEWARLAAAIPETLRFFVEKNRIPAAEYLRTRGRDYRNTPFLRVYGRAGRPCLRCGAALERTRIGGRSSVFCPRCQPVC